MNTTPVPMTFAAPPRRRGNRALPLILAGCAVMLLAGAAIYPQFLSIAYLQQQVQIASFLGVAAAGTMLVILLGHIDLSLPWTLTGAAIVATTLGGTENWAACAIPAALAFGALIGAVNGAGVAWLRIPSMVWTLAVNAMLLGLAAMYTGGFKPKGASTEMMTSMALGQTLGAPHAALVWLAVSVGALAVLRRTPFGLYILAIGNAERVAFLSGVRVRLVVLSTFVAAGVLSALAGILLAGYVNQSYQSMGDPYMLPAIAAVVLGGTSILGGRGSYAGTVAGVLFVTLLTSILSVAQVSEAGRQISYGLIIIAMLLASRS